MKNKSIAAKILEANKGYEIIKEIFDNGIEIDTKKKCAKVKYQGVEYTTKVVPGRTTCPKLVSSKGEVLEIPHICGHFRYDLHSVLKNSKIKKLGGEYARYPLSGPDSLYETAINWIKNHS